MRLPTTAADSFLHDYYYYCFDLYGDQDVDAAVLVFFFFDVCDVFEWSHYHSIAMPLDVLARVGELVSWAILLNHIPLRCLYRKSCQILIQTILIRKNCEYGGDDGGGGACGGGDDVCAGGQSAH